MLAGVDVEPHDLALGGVGEQGDAWGGEDHISWVYGAELPARDRNRGHPSGVLVDLHKTRCDTAQVEVACRRRCYVHGIAIQNSFNQRVVRAVGIDSNDRSLFDIGDKQAAIDLHDAIDILERVRDELCRPVAIHAHQLPSPLCAPNQILIARVGDWPCVWGTAPDLVRSVGGDLPNDVLSRNDREHTVIGTFDNGPISRRLGGKFQNPLHHARLGIEDRDGWRESAVLDEDRSIPTADDSGDISRRRDHHEIPGPPLRKPERVFGG